MREVKRRFRAIDRILGAKKPRTLDADLDDEFMWLQLRQIVELVTFSAMLADEERYAARRAKQGDDYQRDGKAGKVLRHLSNVSLHFLPQALGSMTALPDGTKRFEGTQQQATLDRLIEIHEAAGRQLHAHNPADVDGMRDLTALRLRSRERVVAETAYLKAILWEHFKVGLQRPFEETENPGGDARRVWILSFGRPEEPDVQMAVADAVEEPDVD